VESFQPREGVQHLWARFRLRIEPVPLIWSRVPLEISSTVFVDWGAMISGDAKFVARYRVLHRFHEIICRGTTLNWFYFWEVFSACNNPRLVVLIKQYVDLMLGDFTLFSFLAVVIFLVAMDHGNWAHSYHNRRGHEWDMVIGTAMINIYNPCERADQAHKVFEEMPRSNTLTSTTLISLLTIHGLRTEAKDVFGQMEIFGVESIFVTMLLACSQAVLGGNGRWRFDMNRHNHSRELPVYYHICLVDILDRVGLIEVTEKVLEDMLLRCVPLWVATLSPIPSMLQHHSGVLVWLSNLPLRQARNCVMTLQLDAAAVRVPPYYPMSKGWPPPNFHLEDKVFFGGRVLIGFHTFSNEMLS
ncbi:Pentatricopeptide repeat, partial [Trema orientale]